MIQWRDIREQFPVTADSVYLNTAAAGPLARATAQAGISYYEQMKNEGICAGTSGSRSAKKYARRSRL